MQVSALSMK